MAVQPTEPDPTPLADAAYGAIHALALRSPLRQITADPRSLIERRLVQPADGGFELTAAGHRMHRVMLEQERATLDLDSLGRTYAPIPGLARRLGRLRKQWEQRENGIERRRLVARFCSFVTEAQPVLETTAAVLARFSGYLPRLQRAAVRLRAGDFDYAIAPEVDSIWVVWQDLHEDYLQTLGRGHDLEESCP
jgi:hypothetical protein